MKPLRLIPDKTKIGFIRLRHFAYGLSGLGNLAAAIVFLTVGLNFGIDFRGGTLIQIATPQAADLAQIRGVVSSLGLGDVAVQGFGKPNEVLIRIETQKATAELDEEKAQQAALAKAEGALKAAIPEVEILREEVVGPKVSGELVQAGILAVVISMIAMFAYIWFRFEWQFSVGAVVALVHDVFLTIGVFSVLQLEFNLQIIAALLTIVGYSMNDTVVVFDRVRENLRKYKKMPLEELIDLSVNDTLSRTIMTSGTTLIALVALYAFGGEVIRGFTFAMIWGICVGTYSSIYVASPILLVLDVKRDWSSGDTKSAGVRLQ
ncbi:MAG: protein translocase subunit SecF [Alphaproteobacteria bacterium]|nr:protein translocase subunit SecF [Alphaproteobacteria bacterium]